MLKLLQNIDNILCVRLTLHEKIPAAFQRYTVRDGRVTFVVDNEFELDLSIADEDPASQFFFVDLRFTFSPSSSVPDGRLREQLEGRLNHTLRNDGLSGCHNFLHNLVLSNKLTALFKQARAMARGGWIETLRVDLIRRTLVVQYWLNRPDGKSWIEIGVKSGRRKEERNGARAPDTPYLDLHWVQDKNQIQDSMISFDTSDLSMDATLRSVVALHSSNVLEPIYSKIIEGELYANGQYLLELQASTTNPEDCFLEMQITKSSFVTVMVEPASGSVILRPSSQFTTRMEDELNRREDRAKVLPSKIALTRCVVAQDFLQDRSVSAGWTLLPNMRLRQEPGQVFGTEVLRWAFLHKQYWTPNWVLAMTHSMDGDHWWLLKMNRDGPGVAGSYKVESPSIHTVVDESNSSRYFRNLERYASGLICFHTNSEFLQMLGIRRQTVEIPKFDEGFRLPKISLCFQPGDLPGRFRQSFFANTGGQSWLSETVTVTIEEVNDQKQAVYTAKGRPHDPANFLKRLADDEEHRVVFDAHGSFVMKFTAPVGVPVVVPLLHRLQHLDRVLSAINAIKLSRFTFTSFSLSRIAVVYEQTQGLRLKINFVYKEPSASVELDTYQAKTSRATLEFPGGNPHKRIQHHLTTLINNTEARDSVNEALKQLSMTLNLMRVFNALQQHRESTAVSSELRITNSSGIKHTLHYKRPNCSFTVYAKQHRDAVKWIVQNTTSSSNSQTWPDGLAAALRRDVFAKNTVDWTGLDSGASADTSNPGPMLKAVDEVVRSFATSTTTQKPVGIATAAASARPPALATPGDLATTPAAGASAAEAISLD